MREILSSEDVEGGVLSVSGVVESVSGVADESYGAAYLRPLRKHLARIKKNKEGVTIDFDLETVLYSPGKPIIITKKLPTFPIDSACVLHTNSFSFPEFIELFIETAKRYNATEKEFNNKFAFLYCFCNLPKEYVLKFHETIEQNIEKIRETHENAFAFKEAFSLFDEKDWSLFMLDRCMGAYHDIADPRHGPDADPWCGFLEELCDNHPLARNRNYLLDIKSLENMQTGMDKFLDTLPEYMGRAYGGLEERYVLSALEGTFYICCGLTRSLSKVEGEISKNKIKLLEEQIYERFSSVITHLEKECLPDLRRLVETCDYTSIGKFFKRMKK